MSKQKLIITSGLPYVSKTTVADSLFKSYENSAHCGGDWMWRVNPFFRVRLFIWNSQLMQVDEGVNSAIAYAKSRVLQN